jgi:hypothetical protein
MSCGVTRARETGCYPRQAIWQITMFISHHPPLLRLSRAAQAALVAGARDNEPVRGLTHGFYKYPARFSPIFARAAIEAFTQPGDLVLDNHVGGGTTLVEALATGRHAIGVDISALAEFVTSVKTTMFTEAELDRLQAWARCLPSAIHVRKSSIYFADDAELGYYKYLDHPSRWRLRKAIEQGLGAAIRLAVPRLESFGRCVVLRAAQRALDGRAKVPALDEFRNMLETTGAEMVSGARALRTAVDAHGDKPTICVIAAGLEDDKRLLHRPMPRLVVTSPPYPGVQRIIRVAQVFRQRPVCSEMTSASR